jgi:hypothetical protein
MEQHLGWRAVICHRHQVFRIHPLWNNLCLNLVALDKWTQPLIVILLLDRNSRIDVSQHRVMYGTHSLGFSRRWKPQPDSSCRDLSAIRIMFPTESPGIKWSVKCCTCHKPCSTLMSMRAIPRTEVLWSKCHTSRKWLVHPKLVKDCLKQLVYELV